MSQPKTQAHPRDPDFREDGNQLLMLLLLGDGSNAIMR